jgi:hypothetical protein
MATGSSNLTLAIGLSLGGAFIGAGLYFGLRARPAAAPDEKSPSSLVASSAAPITPSGAAIAPGVAPVVPSAALTADRDVASAEIARQLEAQRAVLRTKCWAPSIARTPTPDHGSFVYEYTFDPTGTQRARGITPATRIDRDDVALCLTGETQAVSIAPQGTKVHLRVPFALP